MSKQGKAKGDTGFYLAAFSICLTALLGALGYGMTHYKTMEKDDIALGIVAVVLLFAAIFGSVKAYLNARKSL